MIRFIFLTVMTIFAMSAYSIDYVFRAGVGIGAAWKVDDKIGLFAENDLQTRFVVKSVDSGNNHQATCQSPGVSLKNEKRYFAISPYNVEYYQNDNLSTSLPISFPQLTQAANDDLMHIAGSDLMIADVLTSTSNEATFNFRHLGSVLRLCVKVPEDATFTECALTTSRGNYMQSGTLNIETSNIGCKESSASLGLFLDDINVERGKLLVVYFIIPPLSNLEGGTITAIFKAHNYKTYSCQFSGHNYIPGNVYNVERTVLQCEDVAGARAVKVMTKESSESKMRKVAGVVSSPYVVVPDFTFADNDVFYAALPPLTGDADNNGVVNNDDVIVTAEYIIGNGSPQVNNAAADANKDGKINVGDLTKMSNIIKRK